MKSPGWKDWAYLGASVAASYYLVMQQKGQDDEIEIRFLWGCVKIVRGLRRYLGKVEAELGNAVDAALERKKV